MYSKRVKRTFASTKKILRAFSQSKRAMIGVGIITFFAILAITAPLLTPYNPTLSTWLAGSGQTRAKPIWFKYLPGGDMLSENLSPITDPEFSTPQIEQNWNITTLSSYTNFEHVAGIGEEGSLGIMFLRKASQTPQVATARVCMDFTFPFSGPPARFSGDVTVLIEDEVGIPIQLTVFIEDKTNNKNYTWGFGYGWADENVTETTTTPLTPSPGIESGAQITWRQQRFNTSSELGRFMFPQAANYSFGLEITFWDLPSNAGKSVKAIAYVDTLDLDFYGTAFGLLGTDWQGRDIFTQLAYGTRISIIVGILASVISVLLGLIIGLISGYLGGLFDESLMRINDALLVLPGLPLLIVLIAVLGNRIHIIILVLGFLGWMGFARVVRSQVLSLKERPFIEAAKAIGSGTGHIIFKHIVPNVMGLVYVTLASSVPGAIVGEAALSWLGYYDPYLMSWGRMLNDVQTHHGYNDWWWVVPPGLCIAAISVAFILLGYALDEILNPKLRIRR
ncbi:ABC transporter permease [Candidatus Bathyarchaeota archaeon]|nr:ABC transporter permease [Candidatus Bathyarchaeota archaeon]